MSGFEYLGILQDMKMDSLAAFRNPYELNISSSTTLGNGTMTNVISSATRSAAPSARGVIIDPETGKPLQRNVDPNAVWYDPATGLPYGVSPSTRRPVSTTKSGMSTKHVVGYGIGALVVGYALFMGYKALQDRR